MPVHRSGMSRKVLKNHLRRFDADACRRSLAEFVRLSWPIVEPGVKLKWNWHVDALCEHLEAVTEGRILKLVINMPPGLMKSTLVGVMWKAWEWIDRPHLRYLTGSYDEKLAMRDATKTRDIVSSSWYRDLFQPKWKLRRDSNAKSYYVNTRQGFRLAFPIGGKVTGWRGDGVLLDDPLNARDQYNAAVKAATLWKYDKVLSTRINDPSQARFIIVMQRLADDDLSGELLRRTVECVDENGDPLLDEDGNPRVDADGAPLQVPLYDHLCLPSEFEPGRYRPTSIGWRDPRTEPGELLFPAFHTPKGIAELKQSLGSEGFAGQHQQRPVALDGGRFKRPWFTRRVWRWEPWVEGAVRVFRHGPDLADRDAVGELILLTNCSIFGTVDVAVGEKKTNDYTCYGIWAVTHLGEVLLLQELWKRMSEPESITEAQGFKLAWPRLTHFVVEKNGVGFPLVQQMLTKGLAVLPIDVHADKLVKSTAAVVMAEAGRIFIPDPEQYEWVGPWLAEVTLFPGAGHDDRVTCLSLAAEQVFTGAIAIPGQGTPVEAAPASRILRPGADRSGSSQGILRRDPSPRGRR